MAEWLKTKGLHKLYSVFKGVFKYKSSLKGRFIFNHLWKDGSWLVRVSEKLKQLSGNFPEGGDIWTAFWSGEGGIWTKIFQKFKCPGGCGSFDLTGTLLFNLLYQVNYRARPCFFYRSCSQEEDRTVKYRLQWIQQPCSWWKLFHLLWWQVLHAHQQGNEPLVEGWSRKGVYRDRCVTCAWQLASCQYWCTNWQLKPYVPSRHR